MADRSRLPSGNPGFHRFQVGAVQACVLTDGPIPLPVGGEVPLPGIAEIYPTLDAAELRRTLEAAFLLPDQVTIEQNILLAEIGGELVLFDTGCGDSGVFGPDTGRLLTSLAEAGLEPEAIDAVVFSHAHSDHCWGTVRHDGTPTFPRARLYMSQTEFTFWDERPADDTDPGTLGFRRQILPLRDRLQFFSDGEEILPGVVAVATPGHTPGHCSFMLTSQGETLCVLADVVLHHPVSFSYPAEPSGFDTDPQRGIATRTDLLERLSRTRTRLLGYHMPWPGLGYIAREGQGFRFTPEAGQHLRQPRSKSAPGTP